MSEHHQTVAELVTQAASSPKTAAVVAGYSTAAGTIGILTELQAWLGVVSLSVGIILSLILITIHARKLYKELHP